MQGSVAVLAADVQAECRHGLECAGGGQGQAEGGGDGGHVNPLDLDGGVLFQRARPDQHGLAGGSGDDAAIGRSHCDAGSGGRVHSLDAQHHVPLADDLPDQVATGVDGTCQVEHADGGLAKLERGDQAIGADGGDAFVRTEIAGTTEHLRNGWDGVCEDFTGVRIGEGFSERRFGLDHDLSRRVDIQRRAIVDALDLDLELARAPRCEADRARIDVGFHNQRFGRRRDVHAVLVKDEVDRLHNVQRRHRTHDAAVGVTAFELHQRRPGTAGQHAVVRVVNVQWIAEHATLGAEVQAAELEVVALGDNHILLVFEVGAGLDGDGLAGDQCGQRLQAQGQQPGAADLEVHDDVAAGAVAVVGLQGDGGVADETGFGLEEDALAVARERGAAVAGGDDAPEDPVALAVECSGVEAQGLAEVGVGEGRGGAGHVVRRQVGAPAVVGIGDLAVGVGGDAIAVEVGDRQSNTRKEGGVGAVDLAVAVDVAGHGDLEAGGAGAAVIASQAQQLEAGVSHAQQGGRLAARIGLAQHGRAFDAERGAGTGFYGVDDCA